MPWELAIGGRLQFIPENGGGAEMRLTKWKLFALLSMALMTVPALALTPDMQMTGEAFSDACTRPSESWVSFCNGYVQSVIDSIQPSAGVCIPLGTTRTDIVTEVEKIITRSADMRLINAHEAVLRSILATYPCTR